MTQNIAQYWMKKIRILEKIKNLEADLLKLLFITNLIFIKTAYKFFLILNEKMEIKGMILKKFIQIQKLPLA
jgi:hypothetical protein